MSQQTSQTVSILLVEDDKIDQKSLQRSFKKMRISNPLQIANDGVEAWDILTQADGAPELSRPFMIILDINMPRMNGIELLRKIRAHDTLKDTIVFMLTTSNDEKDKFEAFNCNVAGYMLKTDMDNSFMEAVELVENYWRVVEFPANVAVSAG